MLCVPKDLFGFIPLQVPTLEIQTQFWEQTTSLSSHISSPVIKTRRSKHALGDTSPTSFFASDEVSVGILSALLGASERAGPRLLLVFCLPWQKKKTKCKTISKWQGWDVIACCITLLLLDVILCQCCSTAEKVLSLSLGKNFAFQCTWIDKCQSCYSQQLSFKPREQRKLTLKPLIHGIKPEEFNLQWHECHLSDTPPGWDSFSLLLPLSWPQKDTPTENRLRHPTAQTAQAAHEHWDRTSSNLITYWNRSYGHLGRAFCPGGGREGWQCPGLWAMLGEPCSSQGCPCCAGCRCQPSSCCTKAVPSLGCKFNLVGS